jgi:hypothetical protein
VEGEVLGARGLTEYGPGGHKCDGDHRQDKAREGLHSGRDATAAVGLRQGCQLDARV